MVYCRSLIKKRKEFYKERSQKGVLARERNRIEVHQHEPVRQDIDDSIEITVTRRIGGTVIQNDRYLLINEEGRGTINQYDTWNVEKQEYIGLMGIYKAFIHAAGKCPRIKVA